MTNSTPAYNQAWREKNREHVQKYRRDYYLENQDAAKASSARVQAEFRAKIVSLKSERPCYDCGGVFAPESMDFDHVSGEKSFQISTGWSIPWDDLRREIDKCQLVCANCHRVRTRTRRIEKYAKRP